MKRDSRLGPAIVWLGVSVTQVVGLTVAIRIAGGAALPSLLVFVWLLLFAVVGTLVWTWGRGSKRWRLVRFVAALGAQAAVFDPITWSAAFAAARSGLPYPQLLDTLFAWFGLLGWAAIVVSGVWALLLFGRRSRA